MLLPSFAQFSTHLSWGGEVIHKAYIRVDGLDHVSVEMDVDGQAKAATIYVPGLKMFFETRERDYR